MSSNLPDSETTKLLMQLWNLLRYTESNTDIWLDHYEIFDQHKAKIGALNCIAMSMRTLYCLYLVILGVK